MLDPMLMIMIGVVTLIASLIKKSIAHKIRQRI